MPEYEEAERPEVDHDTKNVAGTPDITKTILEEIATANVFVADMTPVGITDPAALQPSPNGTYCAPCKGTVFLRVRTPSGNCRSSR